MTRDRDPTAMSEKQTYELPPQAVEEALVQTKTNAAKAPTDPEKEREAARQANPNGFVSTKSGVGEHHTTHNSLFELYAWNCHTDHVVKMSHVPRPNLQNCNGS